MVIWESLIMHDENNCGEIAISFNSQNNDMMTGGAQARLCPPLILFSFCSSIPSVLLGLKGKKRDKCFVLLWNERSNKSSVLLSRLSSKQVLLSRLSSKQVRLSRLFFFHLFCLYKRCDGLNFAIDCICGDDLR